MQAYNVYWRWNDDTPSTRRKTCVDANSANEASEWTVRQNTVEGSKVVVLSVETID